MAKSSGPTDDNRRALCIEAVNNYIAAHPLKEGAITTRNKDYLAGMVEIFNNPDKYGLKYTNPPKHLAKVQEVVAYLNEKAGTTFETNSKAAVKFVSDRINEGRSVTQMKFVIDKKVKQWLSDPKMRLYLRPATLFNSEKFEQYLNEPDTNNSRENAAGHSGNKAGNSKPKGDSVGYFQSLKLDRKDNLLQST
jgi:uncharacterized phage protein (TIGR02220 family)